MSMIRTTKLQPFPKQQKQRIKEMRLSEEQWVEEMQMAQVSFQRRMEAFMKKMGNTASLASTYESPAVGTSETDKETQ